jgi:hypothetical protein
MFDLEKQIASWRHQLTAAGIKPKPSLDELENHLREHIAQQTKTGSSESQAFEAAVERMGPIPSLAREFKKVAAIKHAQMRRRAGFAFVGSVAVYSFWVIRCLCLCDLSVGERSLGFASVATLLSLFYLVWHFGPRFFPIIPSRSARSLLALAVGSPGIIWIAVFLHIILPRLDLDLGPFMVAILWAAVPVILLPTLAFLITNKSEYHELTANS